jgi:hypothetical protein
VQSRQVDPLERETETKVSEYAEALGCLVVKLNLIGRIGWPDRMYLYMGKVLFIEFKRKGEEPEKIQLWTHGQIRKHKFKVVVVDNIPDGKVHINELVS